MDGLAIEVSVRSEQDAALDDVLSVDLEDAGGVVAAPMPGRVVKVFVAVGDEVERGTPVAIIEAMKMENEILAPCAGSISKVAVAADDTVDAGQLLCEITPFE